LIFDPASDHAEIRARLGESNPSAEAAETIANYALCGWEVPVQARAESMRATPGGKSKPSGITPTTG